ncbi:MAG: sulfur carrier protein ThiS adenylyltransferase ThiF [Oscillospiraceae bacterium]|nr:sulfur carrier protein ThiS adenylyltransferase ThiF [Oscillospiraceae bacterium]
MRIILNGKPIESSALTAFALRTADEVVILNGFQLAEDRPLCAGDQVVRIRKGIMPGKDELEAMMSARHTPGVHSQMKAGRVAIAGLGGLGSHIAVMLTRMGVGALLLVDFDVVEPSNLNRQHYTLSHLATPKTEALKSQLVEINPFIEIQTQAIKITAENAREVFAGYPIVVEAFDSPTSKADLINALLPTGDTKIVAASGLAGFDSANNIRTRRRFSNLYLVGDLESEAREGMGLMAPRVSVCAGHQANMVIRLLMGLDSE